MHCPISFIPLCELEHPVVFRAQKVSVVYDAEHIITWLQTSRRNPTTNELINPLVPLKELLVPHRLPHTTDTQWLKTQTLLIENESTFKAFSTYSADLWNRLLFWLFPVFDLLFTPLFMAMSVLVTMVLMTVMADFALQISLHLFSAMRAQSGPKLPWYLAFLELVVREHSGVIVVMNRMYARFFHPYTAFILEVYFGSDCATRRWCEGLVFIRQSALYQDAASHVMGLDVLLGAYAQLHSIRQAVTDAEHLSTESMVRRFALHEAVPFDTVRRLQQRLADAHALCDRLLTSEDNEC